MTMSTVPIPPPSVIRAEEIARKIFLKRKGEASDLMYRVNELLANGFVRSHCVSVPVDDCSEGAVAYVKAASEEAGWAVFVEVKRVDMDSLNPSGTPKKFLTFRLPPGLEEVAWGSAAGGEV